MKKFILLKVVFFIFALSYNAKAQLGANDPTFNLNDDMFGYSYEANDTVYATAMQSDGKIIIGGSFTFYNTMVANRIARLNTAGYLDVTFDVGLGANGSIFAIAVQNDGKIIIGGIFSTYNGSSKNCITRLNANGSLDSTFNVGIGTNNYVNTITIQNDGKIIIGGSFTSYNGIARNYITRLNPDGSLDAAFNIAAGPNSRVRTITMQNNGKIIIGGNFWNYNGINRKYIARLNSDGSLDYSFNIGTGADLAIYVTALQNDGKIIIGGGFWDFNNISKKFLARLNTDGSLDTSFNPSVAVFGSVYAVAIQSDGKIIIETDSVSYNRTSITHVVRLNSDGSLDSSFYLGNVAHHLQNGTITSIIIPNNNKIVISGTFAYYNETSTNNIVCLNTNGSIDTTFNIGMGANKNINTTTIQSDGKIIIGGNFTYYNGTAINRIARLNFDGTLDYTFNVGIGVNSSVFSSAIQGNGKIIISGNFTSYNGIITNRIARLNLDGSIDTTFNIGTGANNNINAIAIQDDGKIIIGGSFTTFNNVTRNCVASLNIDGSLDTTFNVGTGANSYVVAIAIQNNGKIILGGGFTSYNGVLRNHIVCLNPNGSLDNTFNVEITSNSFVNAIAIQNDEKIVIGGHFIFSNGFANSCIIRLNTDGSFDNSFCNGISSNNFSSYSSVFTITIQAAGKIIIGGDFTIINGLNRSRIALLNNNGSLDEIFNLGYGVDGYPFTTYVKAIALQNDGRIIIGGDFISYNGIGKNRIARILGDEITVLNKVNKQNVDIFPNPSKGIFYVNNVANSEILIYSMLGEMILTQNCIINTSTLDLSKCSNGIYFIKVNKNKITKHYKVVLEK